MSGIHSDLLPDLFRQEYAKMTAVLCRHFGLDHIEAAEDIASDTFLKASEHWAVNGIPENPTAWLYAVAKNKAKDYLKQISLFHKHLPNVIRQSETETNLCLDYSSKTVSDSQLAVMFSICHPCNSAESQICLALQILCGFSVDEIAHAFLISRETIKKRLQRARDNLRRENFTITTLTKTQVELRLPSVLKTLYLLFNEGYSSVANDQLVRKDFCSEAMRLTFLLSENTLAAKPETYALLALMCYQSSRLDARINDDGDSIPFEDQDKTAWDRSLIDRGNYYLILACDQKKVSTFHIEAAIAYWHTTDEENKWEQILLLYDQLIVRSYSPVTALNRAFAYAKVYGVAAAILQAEKLNLTGNHQYHKLLGYLYAGTAVHKATYHFEKAIALTRSMAERRALAKKVKLLTSDND